MPEVSTGERGSMLTRLQAMPVVGIFFGKSFLHYAWTGGVFTVLNIFLVWLFIEVFKIPTIISSTVVIGGLFFGRYLVFRWLNIL